MDTQPEPKEGTRTKLALALILSVCFFLGSCIASTTISEILDRHGLSGSPLIYAVALFPLALIIVIFEERVQQSRRWASIKKFDLPESSRSAR